MKTIGGFLPLELAPAGEPYHAGAVALTSGRACWHAILRSCRPSRVLVPFYVCDAVLQPLYATATPFVFYPITDEFGPDLQSGPAPGELLLIVNYFGLLTAMVDAYARSHPERVAVDDTQAFFRRGNPGGGWSFNSARKFFGVPDGGFLYGPATGIDGLPPSASADCNHLLSRLAGDDERAWDQFKAHETRIGIEPRAMSVVSARLLDAADMSHARCRRRSNFAVLHRRLGSINTIALSLDMADGAPMCYPFLPAMDVDRAALREAGVFVPVLWPEIELRREPGFERERLIARRLLPLPIDQRYGPDDMNDLCEVLPHVLR
jgi:hypothetical protein